jgi:hypothetical protein
MLMFCIFLFILIVCSNPNVQQQLAKVTQKDKPDWMTGLILAILGGIVILLISYVKKQTINEPFLFKVSDFNPRCNGMYIGKPTTFQYSSMGCKYDASPSVYENNPDVIETNLKSVQPYCTEDKNPPLGYIVGDKNKDAMYSGNPHIFQSYGDTY